MRAGHKLHAAAEFERARKSRERLANEQFIVQWTAGDSAGARLGMAVSARAAGNAVNRNRLRRLIRESFRMHREILPAVDLLVTARASAAKATNREVLASLQCLWQSLGAAP